MSEAIHVDVIESGAQEQEATTATTATEATPAAGESVSARRPTRESLLALGIGWADAGLTFGRTALGRGALALDRAALWLGELQERLHSGAPANDLA